MSTPNTNLPEYKLNVFALPSHTTLLFYLMLLVVGIIFANAFLGQTTIGESSLIFGVSLVMIYWFLRMPDRKIEQADMQPLAEHHQELANYITKLAKQIKLRRQPKLLCSEKRGISLHTFGTLRRNYLIIPYDEAKRLEKWRTSKNPKENSEAEAILLHELSHFKNEDIFPGNLSRWILITISLFFVAEFITDFINSFAVQGLLNYPYAGMFLPDLFEVTKTLDPELAVMLDNPVNSFPVRSSYLLYSLAVNLPLVLGSSILLLWLWRSLTQSRELYADARVAQYQKNDHAIYNMLSLLWNGNEYIERPPQPSKSDRMAWLAWCIKRKFLILRQYGKTLIQPILTFHPDTGKRLNCLQAPDEIYGNDREIVKTAGITMLGFNILLGSAVISRSLPSPQTTIPFVLGFILLSLPLIPHLIVYRRTWLQLTRKISGLIALYVGFMLIPNYLWGAILFATSYFSPETVQLIEETIRQATQDMATPEHLVELGRSFFTFRSLLLFHIGLPITLLLFLLLDMWLKRLALTWYGASVIKKYPSRFMWVVTTWLALVLWCIILPIFNKLTVPDTYTFIRFTVLGPMFLILLGSVLLIFLFSWTHYRFARRCPTCAATVPGWYQLDKTCPSCGEILHPQFIATY